MAKAEQLGLLGRPGRYRAIAMDPPWDERGGGGRGTGNHYATMPVVDMPGVIRQAACWAPHPNAHLWMWATVSHLPDALWLMSQLGFRYVSNTVWDKDYIGMGQYVRVQHEHLLFGVIGDGMHDLVWKGDRSVPSIIRQRPPRDAAGQRIHSRKPGAAYDLIERVSHGPYLEMFAREPRHGWDVWGNEVAA